MSFLACSISMGTALPKSARASACLPSLEMAMAWKARICAVRLSLSPSWRVLRSSMRASITRASSARFFLSKAVAQSRSSVGERLAISGSSATPAFIASKVLIASSHLPSATSAAPKALRPMIAARDSFEAPAASTLLSASRAISVASAKRPCSSRMKENAVRLIATSDDWRPTLSSEPFRAARMLSSASPRRPSCISVVASRRCTTSVRKRWLSTVLLGRLPRRRISIIGRSASSSRKVLRKAASASTNLPSAENTSARARSTAADQL